MKTSEFLRAVMPSTGVFFAAVPRSFQKEENGETKTIHFYKHEPCHSHQELALTCKAISRGGEDAYYAIAAFEKESYEDPNGKRKQRTQSNATHARCMFLDIDCGDGKDYPDQKAALKELKRSIREVKVPGPSYIVSSGYGLHVYWTFTDDITKDHWKPVAKRFSAAFSHVGMKFDPVSGDIARVLRPPGTVNHKRGSTADVEVLGGSRNDVRYHDWVVAIKRACDTLQVTVPKDKPVRDTLNAALIGDPIEYPPADADRIADKCAVMGEMREMKGAGQDEQQWYNALGIIKYTENADVIATDWSSAGKDFSEKDTIAKMEQWDFAPTRCETMRELFSACEGCTLKCNSPIVLGFPEPEHQTEVEVEQVVEETGEVEVVQEVLPALPDELDDFAWVEGAGLKVRREDEDGNVTWSTVCSQFPAPEFIYYDEELESYYVQIKARTAPFKWVSGEVALGTVQKGGANFLQAMGDKCALTVRDSGKELVRFMKTWIDEVRMGTDLQTMRAQMGWQPDDSFLLGNTIYKPDGTEEQVVVARGLARYTKSHMPRGDLQTFVDTIDTLYNKPHFEEYQFFWLASFGSVVLKFLHSHDIGITLAAYSPESGTGKTSVCKAAIANFGDPGAHGQKADGQKGATEHAITVMLGLRHNLPVLIDEISNWEVGKLEEFLYRICSGTPKLQGAATGGLRDNSKYSWNSISFVTTNSPASSQLSNTSKNNQATLARMFDVKFTPRNLGTEAQPLFETLWKNSGQTGAEFVRYVAANQELVSALAHKVLDRLNKASKATQPDRFWMMLAASTITAGLIAKKIGLHQFDMKALEHWTINRIGELRTVSEGAIADVEDVAGNMIREMQSGMICTYEEAKPREFVGFAQGYGAPRADVTGRSIISTHDVYLPVSIVKQWCSKHSVDYLDLKGRLESKGWLKSHDVRYDVGRGTAVQTVRARCWHMNFHDAPKVVKVMNTPTELDPDAAIS